jgi:hypothetical protein
LNLGSTSAIVDLDVQAAVRDVGLDGSGLRHVPALVYGASGELGHRRQRAEHRCGVIANDPT